MKSPFDHEIDGPLSRNGYITPFQCPISIRSEGKYMWLEGRLSIPPLPNRRLNSKHNGIPSLQHPIPTFKNPPYSESSLSEKIFMNWLHWFLPENNSPSVPFLKYPYSVKWYKRVPKHIWKVKDLCTSQLILALNIHTTTVFYACHFK